MRSGMLRSSSQYGAPRRLLDTYIGAAGVYSLRHLRTGYSGPAIRVRRSSDDTEQDIYFLNGVLDTASLLSFVGANNGFVRTWYDQSGFGRHANQTTNADQPQIVSSGSVITQGSKPAIDFLGTKGFTNYSVIYTAAPSAFNVFCVASPGISGGFRGLFSPGAEATQHMLLSQLSSDGVWGTFSTSGQSGLGTFSTRSLLEMQSANGESGVFFFNSSGAGNFATTIGQSSLIGGSPGQKHDGTIQEIIYYESNQSANRAILASGINSFYSIY